MFPLERAFGDEILDAIPRLLLDPRIDRHPRLLGRPHEVERREARAVEILHGRLEGGSVASPVWVQSALATSELGPALGAGAVHVAVDLGEASVQAVPVHREAKRRRHLGRGRAASAGVGHGEGVRDAVRGEEDIAVPGAQPGIEVEGKLAVALDQRRPVGLSRLAAPRPRGRGAHRQSSRQHHREPSRRRHRSPSNHEVDRSLRPPGARKFPAEVPADQPSALV